jgi:two-component system C4-dicarboxylate transport sensor histidine kinase DctB
MKIRSFAFLKAILQNRKNSRLVLLAALALLTLGATLFSFQLGFARGKAQIVRDGTASLNLQIASLESAIAPYTYVAAVLARRPDLFTLLQTENREQAEAMLRRMASLSGSDEIFLARLDGSVFASSIEQSPERLIGWSVAETPCFKAAAQGRLGRFYDVNVSSEQRRYTICAPVLLDETVAGVVEVTLDLERVERSWALFQDIVLAYDANGVVVASNRNNLHFKRLQLIQPGVANIISLDSPFTPWNAKAVDSFAFVELLSDGSKRSYLKLAQQRQLLDWTIAQLIDITPAVRQAWRYTLFTSLSLLLFAALFMLGFERRARLLERMDAEQDLARTLERKVAERTVLLEQANSQLMAAQKDLVQAGKMAGLGQMVATLAHEFNQPVAAIRSYAENSATFLQRGQSQQTEDNLQRIVALTDRMAELSSHLKTFARKPSTSLRPVHLQKVIEAAVELMSAHLKNVNVAVQLHMPPSPIMVQAGSIRLEQVIVNLLSNGSDAMAGQPQGGCLEVLVQTSGHSVLIQVRDHGCGIPTEVMERIFDPFFTTKEVGEGLGLGLSIAYNIVSDFGGQLRAENWFNDQGAVGGAIFMLVLPLYLEEDKPPQAEPRFENKDDVSHA